MFKSSSPIKHRVSITGDGILRNNDRENKLLILETSDGEILVSIAIYDISLNRYFSYGVVRFKTGGKKHSFITLFRDIIFKALELKNTPKSGIEGS